MRRRIAIAALVSVAALGVQGVGQAAAYANKTEGAKTQGDIPPICQLPPELWNHVHSHLNAKDLVRLLKVDTSRRAMALNPELWKARCAELTKHGLDNLGEFSADLNSWTAAESQRRSVAERDERACRRASWKESCFR